ncbi:unnamed protein product [Urochloa humidicola]
MSSACPSFTLSCSNISCSIWFCCGGGDGSSKEEPEQDAEKQYQPADAQLTPPLKQVITEPDHLKPPPEQQPPKLPPPPPPPPPAAQPAPQATVHVCPIPQTIPPHLMPSIETRYPSPPPTPKQTWPQTLLPPALPPRVAAPPKVHDPWTLSTQMIPSYAQSAMMHKPPQQAPWPARQPSKTYQAPPPEQQHPACPHHLPIKSYQDAAQPQALPLGPLVDSKPFMEYYQEEHPGQYFVQGSY